MRAVLIEGTDGFDDVTVTDVPEPTIGTDEVLVEVRASGINYGELWIADGTEGSTPVIPGADVAGLISETGAAVDDVRIGDRVALYWNQPCGDCEFCRSGETTFCPEYGGIGLEDDGGHAEYVRAPAENVLALPDNVSFAEAAAFSTNFGTAWRALLTRAEVGPGDRVLVLGASGGVGHAAVQIAALAGAEVFACTSSEAKAARLRQLDADHVVDYTEMDVHDAVASLTEKRGVDVVVESIGGDTYEQAVRSMTQNGRLVTVGATTGDADRAMLPHVFWKQLQIVGSTGCTYEELREAYVELAKGSLTPVVDDTVSFEEVPDVYRKLESRNRDIFGKIVLTP